MINNRSEQQNLKKSSGCDSSPAPPTTSTIVTGTEYCTSDRMEFDPTEVTTIWTGIYHQACTSPTNITGQPGSTWRLEERSDPKAYVDIILELNGGWSVITNPYNSLIKLRDVVVVRNSTEYTYANAVAN